MSHESLVTEGSRQNFKVDGHKMGLKISILSLPKWKDRQNFLVVPLVTAAFDKIIGLAGWSQVTRPAALNEMV
jgi:hypothetical protein